jgi:hypothetical protein
MQLYKHTSRVFISLIQLDSTETCFHSYTAMIYGHNNEPCAILKFKRPYHADLEKFSGLLEIPLMLTSETISKSSGQKSQSYCCFSLHIIFGKLMHA